jgi:flavin-dependent dehydrogenase
MACVVDRGMLDREMAEKAGDAGATFLLRTSVSGIQEDRVMTRGIGGRQEHRFRVLIAADGPRSTIARLLNMERAKVFLAGIQADLPGACDPRFVEIYPDASPDFFGWSIPTGPGRIRVGLCGGSDVPARFQRFRKRFGDASTHLVTGTLPLGVMPRTYGHRTLFIGDAAGFPKPTSGGGIYTGVRSARHAAVTAAEACSRDDLSDAALAGYERLWRGDFGRELDIGFLLFQLRQRIHPDEMDALVVAMKDSDIVRTIVEYGDMDRPSVLAKRLLLKPSLLRLLGPLVRSGIRSIR